MLSARRLAVAIKIGISAWTSQTLQLITLSMGGKFKVRISVTSGFFVWFSQYFQPRFEPVLEMKLFILLTFALNMHIVAYSRHALPKYVAYNCNWESAMEEGILAS